MVSATCSAAETQTNGFGQRPIPQARFLWRRDVTLSRKPADRPFPPSGAKHLLRGSRYRSLDWREIPMADTAAATIIGPHAATTLPSVEVDSYNLELKDDEGFLGDSASRRAFHAILENGQKPLRKLGTDPFGDTPSEDLSRSKLDAIVKEGKDIEAIAVIQSAIDEYAEELAFVVRRFLKAKPWERTECIVIGGGLRENRVGE